MSLSFSNGPYASAVSLNFTVADTIGPHQRAAVGREAYLADIDRAKRLLGYSPLVHFDEGLRRTLDYFRRTV